MDCCLDWPAIRYRSAVSLILAREPDVRVVLLDAQGPNFCVGADLRHFANHLDAVDLELARMATAFHAMLADLAELPVPVIAAIQGNAVGAGLGMALVADIVLAAPDARFSTGYARLGLSADAGVSFTLTRAVGPRMAGSLLMTARFMDAPEALRPGDD